MGRPSRALVFTVIGLGLLVAGATVLVVQVEVGAAVTGTRTCGSPFDAITGRSGWQQWWVADVEELGSQRSDLVRTEQCPDAVNRRLWVAGLLALAGGLLVGTAVSAARRPAPAGDLSIRRLGTAVTIVGIALTAGGIVALVVLLADPDSTLFLYVDRLVIALIGLIVLVPAIAIIVMGRLVVLLGASGRSVGREDRR